MNRASTCVLVLGLVCSLLLWGCGGGGGGTSTTAPPTQNPAPTISAVSPSSVMAGAAATSVAITGTGFIASSSVELNGTSVATTYDSATSLSATLPASNLSTGAIGKLTVVNPSPGGGTSSTVDFTVNNPAPNIATVTPTSVTAGTGPTVLDVTGTGFVSTSAISWNGAVLTTNFVSGTEVKASVPAVDLAGSAANAVTAVNPAPGGGSSAAVTFTVNSPAPVISSISPRLVPPGVAATITITGTGFEANSVVLWNGAARPTTVVSTTILQVMLSAADLQAQGPGALTVSNPGPGATSSGAAQLVVSSQPVPTIQSVLIAVAPGYSNQSCAQVQVTVTGQNFDPSSTIQANGVALNNFAATSTVLAANLPGGFTSQAGGLTLTVANPDQQVTSDPFMYTATSPAALAVCGMPLAATVYSGSTFSIIAQLTGVNLSGSGNLTLGNLPAGITTPNGTVTLPLSGTTVHLQAAANTSAGTYDIPLNATVGSSSAKGDFYFTVASGTTPGFFFQTVQITDVLGVPIGGSGSLQFSAQTSDPLAPVDYDITPSITGLPPGTTATISPSVFTVGQTLTVTLNAASTAPVTQNAVVTLTATPAAQTGPESTNFYADVTQPPGSLPGNRTDYTPLGGTPFAAAYDATHNLIFASNPDWNRVDVISNATHKVVARIPVKSPRGLDITQDNSHVWVQSASLNVYSIDTTTLHAQQYSLPSANVGSSGLNVSFSNDRLLALSDGTLLLFFADSESNNGTAIWNPETNQERVIDGPPVPKWGVPQRSGDGAHAYATNTQQGSLGLVVYNVSSQSTSSITLGSGNSTLVAVNHDGSRFVLFTGAAGQSTPIGVFDQNLNLIGALPGGLSTYFPQVGGVYFTPDGTKIYEEGVLDGLNAILTIDGGSLNLLGAAPAEVTNPNEVSGATGIPSPFAVDSTGMVLGLQDYGIAFDDSTMYQNYVMNQPQVGGYSLYGGPFSTALVGGAVSGINPYSALIPDIWFGAMRGSAASNGTMISFVAPPSATPGPVNVKLIYPDGEEVFYPQWFSYSTNPEYAVTSGSSPSGGAAGQVVGYGLPEDASGGTVTVGGNTATITTVAGQYPPYTREPLPSTTLAYTFPAGQPGWADLTVGTPNGTGTLPKSIFYASSVTDYASTDTFTAVLFDGKRNQVYLSVGDHVAVFSTTTNQFLTPLQPAAVSSQKQFTGLALSPDGSQLVVADLLDGSIAVINPDAPTNTYAIALPAAQPVNNCPVGPLYVAVTSANQVFLTEGSLPEPSCPNWGQGYVVNLTTKAVTAAQCSGFGVDASSDGNFVAIGQPCLYSVQGGFYLTGTFLSYADPSSFTIAGDGNVVSTDAILGDIHMNMLGSIASPIALYGSASFPLLPMPYPRSRLNASGSLFYRIYPDVFEIVDVQHGALRMRFALTEVIQDTASALAIDSGGRHVYLLTDHGLTVVDLGQAPLSIGHLSLSTAGPGTQVTVRGSGFDAGTTATVGGLAATVSFTDENTLTLTIPAAASGPEDIVLKRADGETYTLENGVVLP
jgi:IPT/TIG domain